MPFFQPPSASLSSKVLLIGLDAADWDLLSLKIAEGKLPHLAGLIARGASGPLRSLPPFFSPSLWATIATGKRPYEHGITGFTLPTENRRGIRAYDSSLRASPAIWEMLSYAHKTSSVVGWWNSAPAEKIQGVMVDETFRVASLPCDQPWHVAPLSVTPSSLASALAKLRVHPQQLSPLLLQRLIPKLYEIDPSIDCRLSAIAKILAEDQTSLQVTLHLLAQEPWDFTSLYLIGLDSLSHQGTAYREPTTVATNATSQEHYGMLIDHAYDLYDEWIGTLVAAAGEETTIVIVSDHGFYHDHRKPAVLGTEITAPCTQHAPLGTLIIAGPQVRSGYKIPQSTLLDICPTLLTLFQLPVGRDMPGNVLSEIFEKPITPQIISSWDALCPRFSKKNLEQPSTAATEAALRQLVALGYLPAAPADYQLAITKAYGDHLFHQALSYLEEEHLDRALPLLVQAHQESPKQLAILKELAHTYWKMGETRKAAAYFHRLVRCCRREGWKAHQQLQLLTKDNLPSPSTAEILEIRHLIAQAQFDDHEMTFIQLFARWMVTHDTLTADQLCLMGEERPFHLFIASHAGHIALTHGWRERGFRLLQKLAKGRKEDPLPLTLMADNENDHGRFTEALLLAKEALNRNSLDAASWLALGKAFAGKNAWKEACLAAKKASKSPLRRSEAYTLLASIAVHDGNHKTVAQRYEKLATYAALRLKKRAFSSSLPKKEEKRLTRKKTVVFSTSDHIKSESIIVTGLPRSGTSLLMQMLVAGGVEAITDQQRLADQHNPRGYFEHEKIKNIALYPDLLSPGKAAKVVIPLLWEIPSTSSCRVILIHRHLQEVITSQQHMAGLTASEKELEQVYSYYEETTKEILEQRSWPLLELEHADIVAHPATAALAINNFLGGYLNTEAMASVVQSDLYRVRRH